MSDLSEETKSTAREIFEGRIEGKTACRYCAGIHATVAGLDSGWQPCPRIKHIERHVDGTVLVVTYWPPGTWEDNVIFPLDVYDDEEES